MTELKMRRLVAAGSSMAVMIVVALVAIWVIQLVAMGVKKAEVERLKGEIARLEEERDDLEDEIDLWLQDWKIEERARQLGMTDAE